MRGEASLPLQVLICLVDRPRTVPVIAKVEKMLLAEPRIGKNIVFRNDATNIYIYFTKYYKNITIKIVRIAYIKLTAESFIFIINMNTLN